MEDGGRWSPGPLDSRGRGQGANVPFRFLFRRNGLVGELDSSLVRGSSMSVFGFSRLVAWGRRWFGLGAEGAGRVVVSVLYGLGAHEDPCQREQADQSRAQGSETVARLSRRLRAGPALRPAAVCQGADERAAVRPAVIGVLGQGPGYCPPFVLGQRAEVRNVEGVSEHDFPDAAGEQQTAGTELAVSHGEGRLI